MINKKTLLSTGIKVLNWLKSLSKKENMLVLNYSDLMDFALIKNLKLMYRFNLYKIFITLMIL
jgi:uncharacterized membrane protein YqhA